MALDTAEKRRSASSVISGLFPPSVTPNASKDDEWRQQAGWSYSGILAAMSSVDPACFFTAMDATTVFCVASEGVIYGTDDDKTVFTVDI